MRSLLCTVGNGTYAIPIGHVVETMRPRPITPLAGAPSFVSGVSIIRGEPLPVVDGARLTGDVNEAVCTRFVVLRVGDRRAALAVGHVVGIRDVADSTSELPPLFRAAEGIAALRALDAKLLVVLDVVRLVEEAAS